MKSPMSIGIIGGGALGGALGKRLSATGATVEYWDVNPKLRTAKSLDDLVANHEVILICTPSQTNRVIARDVQQVVTSGPRPAVISLAKGVEPGFITMDAVLEAELGDQFAYGLVSGPMLATEVSAGQTAGATVATTNIELTANLAGLLSQAGCMADTSTDLAGVARCGVFKNVFALGLGLADGLKLGFNFKSALTVKALGEYSALLKHFGSDPALAYSMAGLGDLLTTGWSGKSYNWRIGHDWATTGQAKGEGINTIRQLAGVVTTTKYPLVHAIESIFFHDANPMILADLLSSNPPK